MIEQRFLIQNQSVQLKVRHFPHFSLLSQDYINKNKNQKSSSKYVIVAEMISHSNDYQIFYKCKAYQRHRKLLNLHILYTVINRGFCIILFTSVKF